MNILKLKNIKANQYIESYLSTGNIEFYNEFINQLENLVSYVKWFKGLESTVNLLYTYDEVCNMISTFYDLNITEIDMARIIFGTEEIELDSFDTDITTLGKREIHSTRPYYLRANIYYKRGNMNYIEYRRDNFNKKDFFTPDDLKDISKIEGVLLKGFSLGYCLDNRIRKIFPYSIRYQFETLSEIHITNLMSWKDIFFPLIWDYIKENIEKDQIIILEAVERILQEHISETVVSYSKSVEEIRRILEKRKK